MRFLTGTTAQMPRKSAQFQGRCRFVSIELFLGGRSRRAQRSKPGRGRQIHGRLLERSDPCTRQRGEIDMLVQFRTRDREIAFSLATTKAERRRPGPALPCQSALGTTLGRAFASYFACAPMRYLARPAHCCMTHRTLRMQLVSWKCARLTLAASDRRTIEIGVSVDRTIPSPTQAHREDTWRSQLTRDGNCAEDSDSLGDISVTVRKRASLRSGKDGGQGRD
jgi:hypothetical protein